MGSDIMESSLIWRSRVIINAYSGWMSASDKVLDIGCGNAVVTKEVMRHFNCYMVGTDVLDYRKRDVPFKIMPDQNSLPFKDNDFDIAMFNDVLHHCERQDGLLREASRVSKRILIFEMEPTLAAKVADFIVNKIHNRKMNIAFNIKTAEEWKAYFKELNFNYEYRDIEKPFLLYPFVNFSFKIEKTV